MNASLQAGNTPTAGQVTNSVITRVVYEEGRLCCEMLEGSRVVLPSVLTPFVGVGTRLRFVTVENTNASTADVHILSRVRKGHQVLRIWIGDVTRPAIDRRGKPFVTAYLRANGLGIQTLYIPAEAIRDYFYVSDRRKAWGFGPTLYDSLQVAAAVTPAELRAAFNVTSLEARASLRDRQQNSRAQRAFNLLWEPELRSCYDSLLRNPDVPARFPYGGYGMAIVVGYLSPDGKTFFCRHIISFVPDTRLRRMNVPLSRVVFYKDHAHYRDPRHKVDMLFDRALLPLDWDSTWSQWRHLLAAEVVVDGRFIRFAKWKKCEDAFERSVWERPLASSLRVTLPADIQQQVRQAKERFHLLGQFAEVIEALRGRLERKPIEQSVLGHLLKEAGCTENFDLSLINWRATYDRFFYAELSQRARRLYLFRNEYIVETDAARIVEIPSVGHATYVFAAPKSLDEFLTLYAGTRKDAIRGNKDGIAERLGLSLASSMEAIGSTGFSI